jgi:hypothetical protein
MLSCWVLNSMILRAPVSLARFARDAADYSGSLLLLLKRLSGGEMKRLR